MPDEIPPIDPDLDPRAARLDARREELELKLLEAEATLKELAHREISQRYWLKWIAAMAGVSVMFAMGLLATHLVHNVFLGPFLFASPAFTVAMIVAPVASITAISVALFFGAFRRFEEKDVETVGNGVAGAASILRGD